MRIKRRQIKKIAFGVIFVALVVASFFGGTVFGYHKAGQVASIKTVWGDVVNRTKHQPTDIDFSLFWDVWSRVNQNYVGEKDNQKRVYGAIEGEVAALEDPYSMFLDPTQAKEFSADLNGDFSGIGAEMEEVNKVLTVVAPLSDSPAEKAGLRPKDIVLKIDDQDATKMGFGEAIQKIRGPKDTKVKLTIARSGEDKPKDITVTRDNIHVQSVTWQNKDGYYYVKIRQFNNDTMDLFSRLAAEMKNNKADRMVLDLRNNPGGFLDAARDTWGILSDKQPIMLSQDKNGNRAPVDGKGNASLKNVKLVMLIDSGSASASEILAGAVQDYGRGKLVGSKSFGKGSVQELQPLSGGASLKITTARWFTPKGRGIDKQGIDPDVNIDYTDNDRAALVDPQLQKAIEIVKGM